MSITIVTLGLLGLACAASQVFYIARLERTHFGVLSPPALRFRLWLWSVLRLRCAILAFDIRKMHDLNDILGYEHANALVAQLVQVRLRPGRSRDIIGQYGGDEFAVIIRNPKAAHLVLERFLMQLERMRNDMPIEQRTALADRTNGLVDGLHAAVVLVTETHHARDAVKIAIDAVNCLKSGATTGSRSTSGAQGTQVRILS